MYNIRTMNEKTLPTMTDEERNEFLEIINTDVEKPMALLDGFEDCLLYYMEDENGNPHAVYCYEDLVETFARKNNSTYTEAVEFIDYNTMRTIPYMYSVGGTPTSEPIIIHRINQAFTTLEDSFYEKQYSDE